MKKRSIIKLLQKLLPISILGCVMVCLRMYVTDSIWYGFMFWNLFLAYLPLVFSVWVRYKTPQNTWLTLFLASVWLLLFPNAHYLVTDFFHLKQHDTIIPLWYDTIMLMTFAWCGILAGCISLSHIHKTIEQKYSSKISWSIITGITLLSGYGMYLGRFLRFNSWDIVSNPINLIKESLSLFVQTDIAFHFYGFSLGFALFIFCTYFSIRNIDT